MAKKQSSKNKPTKFKKPSGFRPLYAVILVVVFSMLGVSWIYSTHAVTSQWADLATWYGCARTGTNGEPPTIKQGSNNGACTKMLKYVLKNGASQNLTVDIYFNAATTAAVTNVQKFTGMTNVTYGVVDTKTWDVMQVIYIQWLNRTIPTSPPPPPNAYIGAKPGFSSVLTQANKDYFNSQWPKWYTVGWCVIGHESHTDTPSNGDYLTGNGDGAFQITVGTWNHFLGIPNANSAPGDVQWVKFFNLYNNGAEVHDGKHHSPWLGTYWANNIGHLIDAQGKDLGSHDYRPGAIPCPHTNW